MNNPIFPIPKNDDLQFVFYQKLQLYLLFTIIIFFTIFAS